VKYRILFITQWFDPEPTPKGLVFANELGNNGFDVEVVTGFPNYPTGKIYPGYKIKFIQRDYIEGVHVTRLPLYPNHSVNSLGRTLNYLSFAISVIIYGLFNRRKYDLIYVYHPPLSVSVAASVIKYLKKVPMVCDIQDIWPDTLVATSSIRNRYLINLIDMLCHYVYNISDKIIVLSPGFKKLIVTRGIPKDKIYIIPNWAYEKSILLDNIQLDKSFPPKHMFKILYAGNVGIAQRLDTVLEAAEIITKLNTRVQFIILGDGVDLVRLKKKASHMDLPNVTFIPQVPMQEVGSYLARADVLLVSLKKDPLFEITIPSKTQAYMAAGKPILMSVSGDASDLVVLSQCGVVSKPEDPSDLAKAVLDLEAAGSAALDVMGLNGKNYYRDELSLQNGVQKFSSIFISLIEK